MYALWQNHMLYFNRVCWKCCFILSFMTGNFTPKLSGDFEATCTCITIEILHVFSLTKLLPMSIDFS